MEGPGQQRLVGLRCTFVVVALEHGAGHVDMAQHVAQAAGQRFLELQLAAEGHHRDVGHQGQVGRVTVQLAEVAAGVGVTRGGAEARAGQAEPERTHGVGDAVADVAEQAAVELLQAGTGVRILRRLHLLQHPWVAEDRTLAEDQQAAGHDVGAFHGDRDRRGLPAAAGEVARPQDDALAADHVHHVRDHFAAHGGAVILGDGRRHRRHVTAVDRRGGGLRQCADLVGLATDAGQSLLDALEAADRQAELLADACIGAGDGRTGLGTTAGGGRQGDRAAYGQALVEHVPALAGHGRATDQLGQRDEHILAPDRTVLEGRVQREVATTDLHAGCVARQQAQGDADIAGIADQAIGIVHAEGQADQRGDRCQGDVALVEGQLDAEHLLAVPLALADDAVIGNRGGVGTGERTGQAEAGHFTAIGQARQVLVLLFLGAVMHQQFTRAQRVGYADGGADHRGHRGQLLDHLVVGQRGEAQAAIFLRDDHAEELVLLDEGPQLRRQVGMDVGDFPVVDHRAQLFDGAIKEGLFFGSQLRLGVVEQDVPVRITGEQFALESDRTGFQRDALGLRQRRQHLAEHLHHRAGQQRLADERQQQRHGDDGQHGGRHDRSGLVDVGDEPAGDQQGHADQRPGNQPHAVVGDERACQQQGEEGKNDAHERAPVTCSFVADEAAASAAGNTSR